MSGPAPRWGSRRGHPVQKVGPLSPAGPAARRRVAADQRHPLRRRSVVVEADLPAVELQRDPLAGLRALEGNRAGEAGGPGAQVAIDASQQQVPGR